jgi:hypothetical protein
MRRGRVRPPEVLDVDGLALRRGGRLDLVVLEHDVLARAHLEPLGA